MRTKSTAHVHLLPAKEAPYVVIVRRKPTKVFHIIRWNTKDDTFEHGSWFKGKIYVLYSDVSFDGEWMVYLARGATGDVWNGCCKLPFLRTHLESGDCSTRFGGGYWRDRRTLVIDGWTDYRGSVPFDIENMTGVIGPEGCLIIQRMKRDGWDWNYDNGGTDRIITGIFKYMVAHEGDDGLGWKQSHYGPTLEASYSPYIERDYLFEFRLREYPDLLDSEVEWATFDSLKNLVFTRRGCVFRYSPDDLRRREPGFTADLNGLAEGTA